MRKSPKSWVSRKERSRHTSPTSNARYRRVTGSASLPGHGKQGRSEEVSTSTVIHLSRQSESRSLRCAGTASKVFTQSSQLARIRGKVRLSQHRQAAHAGSFGRTSFCWDADRKTLVGGEVREVATRCRWRMV